MSCNCKKNQVCEYPDNSFFEVYGVCDQARLDDITASITDPSLPITTWKETIVSLFAPVPYPKPNIESIEFVNAEVQILRQKVVYTPADYDAFPTIASVTNLEDKISTGKKLIIEGMVCVSIQYTADEPEQKVHTYHQSTPFSSYIVLESDADTDITYNVVACIEDIFVMKVCPREVDFRVTMVLEAMPSTDGICTNDSTTGCGNLHEVATGGVCTLREIQGFLDPATDNKWTEFFVPRILEIPISKPDICEIVSASANITVISQRVVKTPIAAQNNLEGLNITGRKLVVELILKEKILYTAKNCEGTLHTAHFSIPYSIFIVVEGTTKFSEQFLINSCIEDIYVCKISDREVFINTTAFVKAAASC